MNKTTVSLLIVVIVLSSTVLVSIFTVNPAFAKKHNRLLGGDIALYPYTPYSEFIHDHDIPIFNPH